MANNSVVGSSNGGLIVASDCFSGGCLLCPVLQHQQLVGGLPFTNILDRDGVKDSLSSNLHLQRETRSSQPQMG
jgi:hypothetical protein